jgi:hypothetical protein
MGALVFEFYEPKCHPLFLFDDAFIINYVLEQQPATFYSVDFTTEAVNWSYIG